MNRKHHNLKSWQRAIDLVNDIYLETKNFPKQELYVLNAQMRRAVISIPSNIAEGAARNSDREFIQYLTIARGSLSELETQVLISKKLGYLQDETHLIKKIDDIFGLINGLINSIKQRNEE